MHTYLHPKLIISFGKARCNKKKKGKEIELCTSSPRVSKDGICRKMNEIFRNSKWGVRTWLRGPSALLRKHTPVHCRIRYPRLLFQKGTETKDVCCHHSFSFQRFPPYQRQDLSPCLDRQWIEKERERATPSIHKTRERNPNQENIHACPGYDPPKWHRQVQTTHTCIYVM